MKENFEFEQVNNLEHDIIQSVWLRGGYKIGKKAYFCHGYREHSSMLGSTINDQKTYLNNFLQQWEDAVDHGQPREPNEVHFSLDMNSDYQKENWLQPSYRLCSLTRLVQNICNANNFTKIINEPTRSMYNSVTATTEISCIDHIYTNARYKCSSGSVIVSGASDHNIVCFTRYTKVPPIPGRVIHKRSYKHFDQEEFLRDIKNIDWSDVYMARDIDDAVAFFTSKFSWILDRHAPWVKFQKRKHFCPSLTDKTLDLIKKRDAAKKRFDVLSGSAGLDKNIAWDEFKKLRNKVNNLKKQDAVNFNKEKIVKHIRDPAKMCKTSKEIMEWNSAGSPTQIEVNYILITRACDIAKYMNEFFIDKVKNIRASMILLSPNLEGCKKIMLYKKYKLHMRFITVNKVKKLLSGLSNSRSTSADGLDNFVIKLAGPYIAKSLHHIMTLSIMQKRFPST